MIKCSFYDYLAVVWGDSSQAGTSCMDGEGYWRG